MSNCTVIPVPALSDYYMYLIIDSASKQAAVVDPVDIDAITKAAAENQATTTTILTTHNHWDHSGGNLKLLESTSTIRRVYGGIGDGVPGCNQEVGDGDSFMIGTNT
ncbi:hypothetical protein ACHAWO_005336 [Cyclotella atomus]|uniref:Metallo-beta-lactamase domain-containing protein n=1 Tax=Cyclotella atomus TaxID=382360 RepID=A0ABD3QWV2_9STRA